MSPSSDPARTQLARRWTLGLVLSLLTIVPIIALGTIAIDAATSTVRERVADGELAIGRTLAEQAERDIELVEQRTASIATRAGLADDIASGATEATQELLDDIHADRDHLRRIAIHDASGTVVAASPVDRVELPQEGSAQHISEATVRVSEERALVVLTYPVWAGAPWRSNRVGTVVAELDLAEVVPGVQEARFGTDGRASLALADGTVIVTGDVRRDGTEFPIELSVSRLPGVDGAE